MVATIQIARIVDLIVVTTSWRQVCIRELRIISVTGIRLIEINQLDEPVIIDRSIRVNSTRRGNRQTQLRIYKHVWNRDRSNHIGVYITLAVMQVTYGNYLRTNPTQQLFGQSRIFRAVFCLQVVVGSTSIGLTITKVMAGLIANTVDQRTNRQQTHGICARASLASQNNIRKHITTGQSQWIHQQWVSHHRTILCCSNRSRSRSEWTVPGTLSVHTSDGVEVQWAAFCASNIVGQVRESTWRRAKVDRCIFHIHTASCIAYHVGDVQFFRDKTLWQGRDQCREVVVRIVRFV